MKKIDVAGLKIDAISKPKLLTFIQSCMNVGGKTWVTTLYSEFLYAALKDPKVLQMLNKADIALPDGIGILWAHNFLKIPLTAKSYLGKILQSFCQIKLTLFKLLFTSKDFQTIPGRELIWDITKMASENNLSIYLLGGFGNTSKIVSNILISKYPNIKTAGHSNKNPDDISITNDIKTSGANILLVAYGPIKQEQWIYKHKDELPSVKLVIGLGGTFDYIAGKRIQPPSIVRKIGLEWLFRLITQPHRVKRIYNATFGLITLLTRYKVFNSYPLRPNVAAVVLNKKNQILICERNPQDFFIDIINTEDRLKTKGYWQLPQGGIDKDENIAKAAEREAAEETGLKNLRLIKISEKIHTYYWNSAVRKFWKNRNHKNVGQRQNIVYFRHLGTDDQVKVDGHEFISYKWVSVNELKDSVHPERLPLAKIIEDDLNELIKKATI